MGKEIPEWARVLGLITTGESWPQADEDLLRGLAGVFRTLAAELGDAQGDLEVARFRMGDSWRGQSAAAADRALGEIVAQDVFATTRATADLLARYVDQASLNVDYAKSMVIGQWVLLAAQIAAIVPWLVVPGAAVAAAAHISVAQLVARVFATQMWRRLAYSLIWNLATQVGLDVAIQGAQFARGIRTNWDAVRSLQTLGTALIGVGVGEGLHRLTKGLVSNGLISLKAAQHWGTVIAQGALHEWSTEALADLIINGRKWAPAVWSGVAGGVESAVGLGNSWARGRATSRVTTGLPDLSGITPIPRTTLGGSEVMLVDFTATGDFTNLLTPTLTLDSGKADRATGTGPGKGDPAATSGRASGSGPVVAGPVSVPGRFTGQVVLIGDVDTSAFHGVALLDGTLHSADGGTPVTGTYRGALTLTDGQVTLDPAATEFLGHQLPDGALRGHLTSTVTDLTGTFTLNPTPHTPTLDVSVLHHADTTTTKLGDAALNGSITPIATSFHGTPGTWGTDTDTLVHATTDSTATTDTIDRTGDTDPGSSLPSVAPSPLPGQAPPADQPATVAQLPSQAHHQPPAPETAGPPDPASHRVVATLDGSTPPGLTEQPTFTPAAGTITPAAAEFSTTTTDITTVTTTDPAASGVLVTEEPNSSNPNHGAVYVPGQPPTGKGKTREVPAPPDRDDPGWHTTDTVRWHDTGWIILPDDTIVEPHGWRPYGAIHVHPATRTTLDATGRFARLPGDLPGIDTAVLNWLSHERPPVTLTVTADGPMISPSNLESDPVDPREVTLAALDSVLAPDDRTLLTKEHLNELLNAKPAIRHLPYDQLLIALEDHAVITRDVAGNVSPDQSRIPAPDDPGWRTFGDGYVHPRTRTAQDAHGHVSYLPLNLAVLLQRQLTLAPTTPPPSPQTLTAPSTVEIILTPRRHDRPISTVDALRTALPRESQKAFRDADLTWAAEFFHHLTPNQIVDVLAQLAQNLAYTRLPGGRWSPSPDSDDEAQEAEWAAFQEWAPEQFHPDGRWNSDSQPIRLNPAPESDFSPPSPGLDYMPSSSNVQSSAPRTPTQREYEYDDRESPVPRQNLSDGQMEALRRALGMLPEQADQLSAVSYSDGSSPDSDDVMDTGEAWPLATNIYTQLESDFHFSADHENRTPIRGLITIQDIVDAAAQAERPGAFLQQEAGVVLAYMWDHYRTRHISVYGTAPLYPRSLRDMHLATRQDQGGEGEARWHDHDHDDRHWL